MVLQGGGEGYGSRVHCRRPLRKLLAIAQEVDFSCCMELTSVSLPLASTTSAAVPSVVSVVATVVVGHLEMYVDLLMFQWCAMVQRASALNLGSTGTRIGLAFGLSGKPEAPRYFGRFHVTLTSIHFHLTSITSSYSSFRFESGTSRLRYITV